MPLDGVGKRDAVEIVPAPGPTLQEKGAFVRPHDHLGSPTITGRQRLDPMNDAHVVMAQNANKLFG
jgi:hypothetical protein